MRDNRLIVFIIFVMLIGIQILPAAVSINSTMSIDHDPTNAFGANNKSLLATENRSLISYNKTPRGKQDLPPEFKAKYGQSWQVKWHSDRDSPHEIYRGRTVITLVNVTNNLTAESIGRNFLMENKNLLKVNLANIQLKEARNFTHDSWRVVYYQTQDGVRVHNSDILLSMDASGNVYFIKSRFYPNVTIATTPKITDDEATEIALKSIPDSSLYEKVNISLIIVPKTENNTIEYHLTWRVILLTHFVYVDAITGEIVLKEVTAVPHSPAWVNIYNTVTGSIYPDKGSAGGSSLVNNNFHYLKVPIWDKDVYSSDDLISEGPTDNGGYRRTVFSNLFKDYPTTWDDAPPEENEYAEVYLKAFLDGSHAKVIDDDAGVQKNVYYYFGNLETDQTYNFDWGNGEVQNLYYHVTDGWKYYDYNLGLNTPKVIVHFNSNIKYIQTYEN